MTKKFISLVLLCFVVTQRPTAQSSVVRIFFVDIGQGAATLIVSPGGRTILVDGGPPGAGTRKIIPLLDALGISTIDYTVVTHYHIDHDSGITEVLNAGRVAGIAYDNGDEPTVEPPGTSTSPSSTRGAYLAYIAATNRPGVTRQTIAPGTVIDLGDGLTVTAVVAGGRLLSGGAIPITNADLNTGSISLLVEYNNFDYLVSGDLTGGGSTSTMKTPDVETSVGQMVGDVDVVQLNHHGSTTASNQRFLSALKAEVAVAQIGESNTFGHPNRETVNKYLHTATSTDNRFTGTGVPPPGTGPVFYQHEDSPAGDDRVSQQGISSTETPGNGTMVLETDGVASYRLKSHDDGGARIDPALNMYAVDGASVGITADFAPTVVVATLPAVPLAAEAMTISAQVNDRESPISSVTLHYALNGVSQSPIPMTPAGGAYQATIAPQPDGTRVDYVVTATAGSQTTSYASGYFSGIAAIGSIRTPAPNGEPLYTGYAARIHGVVSAGSNTFGAGSNDDYVQDATGGIDVYRSNETATPFTVTATGDTVAVVGRVGFNGGRVRLDITESLEKATSPYGISILSPPITVDPQATTLASLSANPEAFEGQLVTVSGVSVVSGAFPITPQQFDTLVTVTDGTSTFTLKIDKDTDIEGFNPGPVFTMIGVVQQDDYLRPFDTGYNVAPRGRPDLGGAAAGATLITIAEAKADLINNVDSTPGADFVPDLINQIVRIRGAVTSIDFRGGAGIEYYVQDATGGIDLFSTTTDVGPFSVGDSIEAVGSVAQFNGLTELVITTPASVSSLPPGTVSPASPELVTLSQLAGGGVGEALEGRLIRLDNVTITSGVFPPSGASGNLTISDGTGSATLRIDSDTNIDGTQTPNGTLSIVGIATQFDPSTPFDSGYQILPRSTADISASVPALAPSPTSVDFGSVTIGGSVVRQVTLTNNTAATLTLVTPFAITGSDAAQFSVGLPAATTLEAAASTTVDITFAPTSAGLKSATLAATTASGQAASVLLNGNAASTGLTTPLVISEFRFRGPTGAGDEFVELYNNSDAPVPIAGYVLRASNGAGVTGARATVPPNVTIPPRGHYLFTNLSYSGLVLGQPYSVGITDDGGVAVFASPTSTTPLDQVGTSAGSAYREGAPLPQLPINLPLSSYERLPGGGDGNGVDTDNNGADFGVATSNPQNLASASTPAIAVSPTTVTFGSTVAGQSNAQIITITNISVTPTTLTPPFSITGADATAFAIGVPAATTLPVGGSTTASVTFQPLSIGTKTAQLTVTSSSGSRVVTLAGDATRATLTVIEDSFTREYGAANPMFTGTLTGLIPGDNITVTFFSPATPTSQPGVHPIEHVLNDPDGRLANYIVNTVEGTLTIVDTTAPVLTLPPDISTPQTAALGAIVTFTPTAVDLLDGSVPVTCAPPSGAFFSIGVTMVTCCATDAQGNTASGLLTVTVTEVHNPGKMTGAGQIEDGSLEHRFEFQITERSTGEQDGKLRYRARLAMHGRDHVDEFTANAITTVVFTSPNWVSFAGTGTWNGQGGYVFEATAVDFGEPGKGRDRFAIVIRDAIGAVVSSTDALLTHGNLHAANAGAIRTSLSVAAGLQPRPLPDSLYSLLATRHYIGGTYIHALGDTASHTHHSGVASQF
jgi:beta-lactamase superfamily II metal-dependent hydrolase/DNA/RNA endonuclease YhcR with UshA esterase domain